MTRMTTITMIGVGPPVTTRRMIGVTPRVAAVAVAGTATPKAIRALRRKAGRSGAAIAAVVVAMTRTKTTAARGRVDIPRATKMTTIAAHPVGVTVAGMAIRKVIPGHRSVAG